MCGRVYGEISIPPSSSVKFRKARPDGARSGARRRTLTTGTTATSRRRAAGESLQTAKSAQMNRREKLEALLAQTPDDVFLRYALALAWVSEGNPSAARQGLEALIASDPQYVPAYFQLAQLQVGQGEAAHAKPVLTRGIEAARRAGDAHAEGEMRGLLEQLP
jgi:Tfp pilus assembly protein PilF